MWVRLKTAIADAASEHLKPSPDDKYRRTRYTSDKTVQLCKDRESFFSSQYGQRLSDVPIGIRTSWRRMISKAVNRDWIAHVKSIVVEAEKANAVGDMRTLHKHVKSLAVTAKRLNVNLTTDEKGAILSTEADRLAVFHRFYSGKFSEAPVSTAHPLPVPQAPIIPDTDEKIIPSWLMDESGTYNEGPISMEEITEATKAMRTGRSPGIDGIPAELLNSEFVIAAMLEICNDLYQTEVLPVDWRSGVFVNIFKGKGNSNDPTSYRPLCLLCHAYKIFSTVLLRRIRASVDRLLRCGQEGFRSGRGCADNLFTLRAVIDYALEKQLDAEIVLVDYSQAFDTVSHQFLQTSLEEHGVPPKLRSVIGSIYRDAIGRIRGADGMLSDPFRVDRGVLQGDTLSPVLFIICLNSALRRTFPDGQEVPDGLKLLPDWILQDLAYADDIALLNTAQSSGPVVNKLSKHSKETATLGINPDKTVRAVLKRKPRIAATTEVEAQAVGKHQCAVCGRAFPTKMGVSCHKRHCLGSPEAEMLHPKTRRNQKASTIVVHAKREADVAKMSTVVLDGKTLPNVYHFKYLGATFACHGGCEEEIEIRIGKAQGTFRSLKHLWTDRRLPLDLKTSLFLVRVISVLLYGCESWSVSVRSLYRIRGFVTRCFATISHEKKCSLHTCVKKIDILAIIEQRRWAWLGHVLRMDTHRNPRRALTLLNPDCDANILAHLPVYFRAHFPSCIDELSLLAQNRKEWFNVDGFFSQRQRFTDLHPRLKLR
jgi:hypothetical protein